MTWLKMGWRNLLRNPGRTLIQIMVVGGSLFLAVFMIHLQEGSYGKLIDEGVRMGSGHLVFYHPKYLRERQYGQLFDPAQMLIRLASDPRIIGYFPRLHLPGLARSSHNNRPALMLGIDFEREMGHSPLLDPKRVATGTIPFGQPGLAFIGDKLAKDLQISVGKKFVITLPGNNGEIVSKAMRLGGTFRTGVAQVDRSAVLIDRKSLAALFGAPGLVHELAIRIRDRQELPALKAELELSFPASETFQLFSWEEAMPEIYDAIRLDRAMGQLIVGILFLIVVIGIANTLLMSVMERTREFGLLRALGLSTSHIRRVVAGEALAIGIAGIAVGLLAAAIVTKYYGTYGLDLTSLVGGSTEVAGMLFEPVIRPIWVVDRMILRAVVLLVLVLLASLYPTRQALKIRPSEAMRRY
ncbi:MAG: ABC transporter permease [Candidatus Riflebacteria bacterium]|nr:ABC transporter permease [Candidatus Riflebacteria bacterium]